MIWIFEEAHREDKRTFAASLAQTAVKQRYLKFRLRITPLNASFRFQFPGHKRARITMDIPVLQRLKTDPRTWLKPMNYPSGRKEKNMFKSKNLIMLITLSILFTAVIPTLVAQEGSGSAKFVVVKTLFIPGNEIKPGSYSVKWESTGSETTVIFVN